MRKLVFLIVSLIILLGFFSPQKKMREISPEKKQELVQYLKTHWKSPEDYVVEKFKDYDIVFIGENHRIKHDLELIHNLIPRLYQAGVYNLGIEFGAYEYQDKVDKLITAAEYDEELARLLMFKFYVIWGYREYMDIYRKAWEINKSLPKEAPKFRIINLMYIPDWNALQEKMTLELRKKVWYKGNPDVYMANIIIKEIVAKRQKALIYSGIHHAFTHYYQPMYDVKNKKFIAYEKNRMGNVIYRKIPGKVFLTFLHASWPTKEGYSKRTYPVGGIIDKIMMEFEEKRVGFDVKESPFGRIRDNDTFYAYSYPNFSLSTFCDGYIFQKHFKDYEGCTVDLKCITEKNLQEAIDNLPARLRKRYTKVEDFINSMREDADIKKYYQEHGLE